MTNKDLEELFKTAMQNEIKTNYRGIKISANDSFLTFFHGPFAKFEIYYTDFDRYSIKVIKPYLTQFLPFSLKELADHLEIKLEEKILREI